MYELKLFSLFVVFSIFCLISFAAPADEPPKVSFDGLKRVPESKVDLAYINPEADFSQYDKVMFMEPTIAFQKDWKRDHRSVSNRDMERIKNRLKDLLKHVTVDVLEEGGYPVVKEAGEDVLLIRPAIVDLYISAPDTQTAGRTRTFVTSAGAATLFVELYDSSTGDILARALDRKVGRNHGRWQLSSSVYNSSEARKAISYWASLLRDRLDEFHGRENKIH